MKHIEAPPVQDGETQISAIGSKSHNISPSSVIGPGFSSTSPDLSSKVIMSARDITIITLLMEVSRLVCAKNLTRVISIIWLLKSQIIITRWRVSY